jgi:hypothetical protein
VRYESPATNGVVAWCLERHDLWVAKMAAGRPKDLEFARALLDAGIVRADELERRVGALPDASGGVRHRILAKIAFWTS